MLNLENKLKAIRDKLKVIFPGNTMGDHIKTLASAKEFYYVLVSQALLAKLPIPSHTYHSIFCAHDLNQGEWIDYETDKVYIASQEISPNRVKLKGLEPLKLKLLKLAITSDLNIRELVKYFTQLENPLSLKDTMEDILKYTYLDKGNVDEKTFGFIRDSLIAKYRHIMIDSSNVTLLTVLNKKLSSPLLSNIAKTISNLNPIIEDATIIGYHDKFTGECSTPKILAVELNKDNLVKYTCDWLKAQRALNNKLAFRK